MPGAWVDPWSCTLVDKTPKMLWGHLVFGQGLLVYVFLEGGHDHMRDVSHMQ
jgi:hypothetical protein